MGILILLSPLLLSVAIAQGGALKKGKDMEEMFKDAMQEIEDEQRD